MFERPGFISKLRFEQLTLGTIPPIITGVRVQKSSAEEIVLDLDLKFAGNPNVRSIQFASFIDAQHD